MYVHWCLEIELEIEINGRMVLTNESGTGGVQPLRHSAEHGLRRMSLIAPTKPSALLVGQCRRRNESEGRSGPLSLTW